MQQKLILVFVLILSAGLSGCSTSASRPITVGDWSATVHGLQGRLLFTEEAAKINGTRVGLVYLELRNVDNIVSPMEIYYDPDDALQYLLDESKRPDPFGPEPGNFAAPLPFRIMLPHDSTLRFRVSEDGWGVPKDAGLFVGLMPGVYDIPPVSHGDHFLSASFRVNPPAGSDIHAWRGVLKLPAVKIPVEEKIAETGDLFKTIIDANGQHVITEKNTSTQVPSRVEKNEVRGQVVDEAGHPVPGAAWMISGTQVLRDGKWARVIRVGDGLYFFDNADADGRFVISNEEPVRFDLQFQKAGYALAFAYEVTANSPDLKVTLKRGERIHGRVTRNVNGKRVAVAGETVELQLPSHDVWYLEQASTSATGEFEFRACAPPDEPSLPPGNFLGGGTYKAPFARKWQVVCHGKVVQVDVKDNQPVEPVNFELEPKTKADK